MYEDVQRTTNSLLYEKYEQITAPKTPRVSQDYVRSTRLLTTNRVLLVVQMLRPARRGGLTQPAERQQHLYTQLVYTEIVGVLRVGVQTAIYNFLLVMCPTYTTSRYTI